MRQIKDHAPRTPVILLTAHTGGDIAAEVARLGACHLATKPFLLDDIAWLAGITAGFSADERKRPQRDERDPRPEP